MKERDSNIELLRIVAALFIIAVHCNGLFLNPLWGGVNNWFSNGNAIGLSRIVVQNITVLGVDLFVLISGFYGIRSKLRSVVNLFTCLIFFYVGCYCWNCVLGHDTISTTGVLENMMAFSHENWFINSYLFLMLFAPLINSFTDAVTARGLVIYTMTYIMLTLYFGDIMANQYWWYNGGYSVVTMVGVYMVGRCLSKMTEKLNTIHYWYLIVVFVVLEIIMMVIRCFTSNEEAWLHYGSPITIAAAVTLFVMFYRLPKFHNKWINWIGVSCLAPFILHTCDPMYSWISRKDISFFLNDAYPMYLLKMMLIIGGVFGLAILLDKVRLFLFNPIIRWAGNTKLLNNVNQ